MNDFKLVDNNDYEYILISTTAKANVKFQVLPNRIICGALSLNILLGDEQLANDFFRYIDGKVKKVLVDVERKQQINLWKIAVANLKKSYLYPYKPNDITMEATDRLLLDHFNSNIQNKKLLIYGTGNISTKLAIRLAERNAKVYICGRNKKKAEKIIKVINSILPSYAEQKASYFNIEEFNRKIDGIISFVSGEKVIPKVFANFINNTGIAIDGGIGNFSEPFISKVIEKNIKILRLDVRIGIPFIEASVNSESNSFFHEYMGSLDINGINVVAGGIIGKEGSVIVDRILKPTQVIGIANGIGGVKSESAITKDDRKSISVLKEYILQSVQTTI